MVDSLYDPREDILKSAFWAWKNTIKHLDAITADNFEELLEWAFKDGFKKGFEASENEQLKKIEQ